MSERTFALVVSLCLLLPGSASALHDANDPGLSKDEQKCLNEVNKNVAKVAKTQGKDICDCIKNGSKGKLGAQTIEECITADNNGKVAKAKSKLTSKVGDKCPPAYDHTPTDPNFLNARALQKELDLVHWWFGSNLDLVIKDQATDKDTAKCQIDVAKAGKKCQDTKLKVYNKCKKEGLKAGSIQTLDDLAQTCLQTDPNDPTTGIPDPKGKVAKACNGKLLTKIQKKCVDTGVSLNTAFPGSDPNGTNDPAALLAWIEVMVECEVCRLLNAVDGLQRNCDLFDDGLANGSCGEEQPPLDFALDHFLLYRIIADDNSFFVSLEDQFLDDPNTVEIFRLSQLANPVRKRVGSEATEIMDPNAHLTVYRVRSQLPFQAFSVELRNQFGAQSLRVTGPSGRLLVPARKGSLGPSTTLDHYRCYTVAPGSALQLNTTVALQDQFDDPNEENITTVVGARRFCNPVDKNGEGIKDPNTHLTCYALAPRIPAPGLIVNVGDQFDPNNDVEVRSGQSLCVPSLKLDFARCGDGVLELSEECDPPNESACPGLCSDDCTCSPPCTDDPNRTVFAGGPGENACQQFEDAGTGCESAWHETASGTAASCFFIADDPNDPNSTGECLGCGPPNDVFGNTAPCTNTCGAPACADATRTAFAGGPFSAPCLEFFDQTSCESGYHMTNFGVTASCFWDGGFGCLGCGPFNELSGACTNTCVP